MHCVAIDPYCMQWSQWSEAKCIPMECSGFHAASLNAEDSMHCGAMDPDCMQWSPCSEAHASRLNVVYFIQPGTKHPD